VPISIHLILRELWNILRLLLRVDQNLVILPQLVPTCRESGTGLNFEFHCYNTINSVTLY